MGRAPRHRRAPAPRNFIVAVVAFGSLLASITIMPAASDTPRASASLASYRHVFVVVMENLGFSGAMSTPSIDSLAHRWVRATDYYGVSHPSLPNYLALTSGRTFGITSDCVDCFVTSTNLTSELAQSHVSYDAFMEGVPHPCYLDPWGGIDYASKHNPFRYYRDVRASAKLCSHLLPLRALGPLLKAGDNSTPRFVWVTPNLCHDGHDCSPAVAGQWLTGFVKEVTSSAAWKNHGVLFVTWDEGEGDKSGLNAANHVVTSGGGGHVLTIVIAPKLRRGALLTTPLNHFSLLATIEKIFDLKLLGHSRSAATFADLLSSQG